MTSRHTSRTPSTVTASRLHSGNERGDRHAAAQRRAFELARKPDSNGLSGAEPRFLTLTFRQEFDPDGLLETLGPAPLLACTHLAKRPLWTG